MSGSFTLMFDAVVNHVLSNSYRFQQFLDGNDDYRDWFVAFSCRSAVAADPMQMVLLRVLEIIVLCIRRGADLLRLDAVTFLCYELGTNCAHLAQTHVIIKLLREVLDVVASHVALITETNLPHTDNITYFGNGSDEAQMVYNFALPPLVLQAFQTGNAETLGQWADRLAPPSVTTCFFNFLDSHDGIGLMGARGILSDAEVDEMCERVRAHGGLISMRTDETGAQSPYELNTTWFSALNPGDGLEPAGIEVDRFIGKFLLKRPQYLLARWLAATSHRDMEIPR